MNLTAEQVEQLKQKIEKLSTKLGQLEKDASENYNKRLSIVREINDYTKMLLTAVTIGTNNADIIGLGSRFTASIDFGGSVDVTDYLISDANFKVPGYLAISTSTPLTHAVMGKKENENFSYEVNGTLYVGTILSIHKDNVLEKPKTTIK